MDGQTRDRRMDVQMLGIYGYLLTYCALVYLVSWKLVNIDSDESLLPNVAKSLAEPMLNNHQSGLVTWG